MNVIPHGVNIIDIF